MSSVVIKYQTWWKERSALLGQVVPLRHAKYNITLHVSVSKKKNVHRPKVCTLPFSLTSSLESFLYDEGQAKELANNGSAHDYLSSLTSFGYLLFCQMSLLESLNQIRSEPERIYREKQSLEREMQDLSWSNYRTFIDSAKCTQFIKQQVCLYSW